MEYIYFLFAGIMLFFLCLTLLLDFKKGPQVEAQVVRLVNGSSSCSGRVEVLHDGQWGTVCDDDWYLSVAELVCIELDCGDAIDAESNAYFGEGSGPIWMDEINCVGNESSLVDCGILGWGIHDCEHNEDAGVTCKAPVRLNGSNSCSGRVEVLHNGTWGTVCTDYWDSTDAAVVCKEVGCPTGAEVTRNSFGPGVGTIWMDNVQCTGTELSLKDCTFNGWGINNCYHSYDAGVICRDVRLVDGDNLCSGRVEVLYNGQWGTVCDAGWDLTDAAVVCNSMGCGSPIAAETGAFFGQGSGPVWLGDVGCSGNEPTVTNCSSNALGTSTCSHGQDAGVICNPPIRLVNGDNSCSGRVEVLRDGLWGTVCLDYWGTDDAAVACKEVGCPTGGEVTRNSYGPGVGPIWMDNVHCTGTELSLRGCRFNGWGINDCYHSYDAGVICRDIRLVDGDNLCSGRVEVLYNDQWGTVCDAGWDLTDAAVVCESMGCGTPIAAKVGAFFGQGSGSVWLDDVSCSGNEPTVKNCLSKAIGTSSCSHGQDAGVVCNPSVRLVNGSNLCSGRVEVLHDGIWGTVCQDYFGTYDAAVVCKEVGCPTGGEPKRYTYFGPGVGTIWMDNVHCTGSELLLRGCRFRGWGINDCDHSNDAGVICRGRIDTVFFDSLCSTLHLTA
ncbi:scavenger receptor cysteine-rich domain-containing protein DMBT1-like [Paramisgurnus dabryanus]|uniref:scavenger receptor cysteine-rich domain-containing protein DMBT1-like n=1 Tax=Paramisgurnus dabryanus TaxID=90735 RepID=UPI003CCF6DF4